MSLIAIPKVHAAPGRSLGDVILLYPVIASDGRRENPTDAILLSSFSLLLKQP